MSDRAPDEPGQLSTDAFPVRSLVPGDADAVARLDAKATGRNRREYYKHAIERAQREGVVSLSLAAENDGLIVGYVIASVAYGEFGGPEPIAVLDAIGVHPDFRHRHVARALVRQLALNLQSLRIDRVRTEVDWRRGDLLGFLAANGFAPAPRLVLEAPVTDLPTA